MRAKVVGLTAVSLVLALRTAQADDRTTGKLAYDQAEALRAQGKWAEACPLYAASYSADPQLGALLHLAACHEQIGLTASAWLEWTDAIDVARQRNDSREAMAKQHADALAPKVSRLSVTLPADPIDGLRLELDHHDVTVVAARGVPVDPGAHELTAQAPGRQPWKTSVTIDKPGQTTTVPIPALEVITTPPPTATPAPTPAPTSTPAPIAEHPNITSSPQVAAAAPRRSTLSSYSLEAGIGESTAPASPSAVPNAMTVTAHTGVTLRAALGKRFGRGAVSYVVQLAWAHKGGKYDYTSPLAGNLGAHDVGYNLQYLEVPVTVRWRSGGNDTHFELGAGGFVGLGISASYGKTNDMSPTPIQPEIKNFKPYNIGAELRASLVISGFAITAFVDASPISPSDEVSGGIETALVLVGYELL